MRQVSIPADPASMRQWSPTHDINQSKRGNCSDNEKYSDDTRSEEGGSIACEAYRRKDGGCIINYHEILSTRVKESRGYGD